MLRKFLTMTWVLLLLAASMPALAQPQGVTQPGEPAADFADHLYLSAKNGQTQEQQWADRYACYNWAKGQSGFDPAKKADGAAPDERASRREQYRRAMTACLEARGYSVQYAAGAPPPSAAPLPYGQQPGTPVEHASRRVVEPKYHPLSVQIEGGYSVPTGTTNQSLDGGSNVGLGLTWFPISTLPVGFRLDGSYSSFRQSSRSLSLASQALGTDVSFGHAHLYGGDLDLELDLRMGPHVKEYFFGGAGRYRAQTTFKQVSYQPGVGCDWWECFYGYFPFDTTVQRSTSGWLNSWNAGMGFEFALASPARFFIEARYLRIGPASHRMDFVPIRVGLRF